MLVLKRKRGETIQIGPDIEVQVLEITKDGRVSVGVTAPRNINVVRKELAEKLESQGIVVYREKAP